MAGMTSGEPTGWARRLANRLSGRRIERAPVESPVSAEEIAEIDAAFERVVAEEGHTADVLLTSHLQPLVSRGVPVRRVTPAPGPGGLRIWFADGTVVVAQSKVPGDIARMASVLPRYPVRLVGLTRQGQTTHLEFSWVGRGSLTAVAVGLDQPA